MLKFKLINLILKHHLLEHFVHFLEKQSVYLTQIHEDLSAILFLKRICTIYCKQENHPNRSAFPSIQNVSTTN